MGTSSVVVLSRKRAARASDGECTHVESNTSNEDSSDVEPRELGVVNLSEGSPSSSVEVHRTGGHGNVVRTLLGGEDFLVVTDLGGHGEDDERCGGERAGEEICEVFTALHSRKAHPEPEPLSAPARRRTLVSIQSPPCFVERAFCASPTNRRMPVHDFPKSIRSNRILGPAGHRGAATSPLQTPIAKERTR